MAERANSGRAPDEQDAASILTAVTGHNVKSLRRFPTGLAHYVYDAPLANDEAVVVRLTRPEWNDAFFGAIYWSHLLRPLGVPLPEIFYADATGDAHGFPVLVLERLAGTDLGEVYPALSDEQKRRIASRIVEVQRQIATLPHGSGFGFAHSYDDRALKPSWIDVLAEHLERSRQRIRAVGVVDESVVDRVEHSLTAHRGYFDSVEPVCFLDDTTTKNVIVADGKLSGIVDVDAVCFGDALRTPALTQMSLLNLGYDGIYIDAWREQLALDREQHEILTLYTAMYCVDFLSELGQRFNQDEAPSIDPQQLRRLTTILDGLLHAIDEKRSTN
jgi:hypothetical protein